MLILNPADLPGQARTKLLHLPCGDEDQARAWLPLCVEQSGLFDTPLSRVSRICDCQISRIFLEYENKRPRVRGANFAKR